MINTINLQNKKVPYTLKINKRSKGLRLAVHSGGALVVTAPPFARLSLIERFIVAKSQWVIEKIDYLSKFAPVPKAKNSRAEYLKHKETARKIAEEKVAKFNQFYGFAVGRIAIKNQKTRWGSCSVKGNLNFNYKIALVENRVAEYIVVHELCHLGEFNHSPKFWALVEKTVPEWREVRRGMRKLSPPAGGPALGRGSRD